MKSEKPGVHYPRLAASGETAVVEADAVAPEEEAVRRRFFDSPHRVVIGATSAIIVGFLAIVVFAAFIPINRGAVAGGQIQATGSRNVVQHLDGGVVEQILIKEGQRVKAGQLLVKLDDRTARLSLSLLEEQRRLLMMEQAALEAESAGRTSIIWPPEVLAAASDSGTIQAMRTSQTLLSSRVVARNSEKAVLREQIARLEEHAAGLQAQKQGLIEQLRLIKVESQSLEELYAKGLTTRTRILALQRNAADLQGSIGTTEAAVNQDKVQMGENRLRILGLDSAMQQENSKRLSDLQKQIFELNDRISSQQLVVQRTAITSPSSGIVLNRAVNSVGMVIRPGEPVVEIVPDERL
ncbi:MAG: HlyD family type I secretion periplasmic adaptor subunit, partial [Caulobacteraceae bacterium]